ncbi:phosphoserine aminotransferase [Flexibacter flexilis DSM 6793]|uniref:phosphoserine transaminase n=1 Tax=Flexibacter flexilis DSM 6793 TaxID=927664 RepID=A0A1I1D826_9BACT|nr:aminotransferase class V-fold PLP-dependent enzyme [Flexibacter flexilis]SFB70964.1 phosphoserine aminotransferase [Flexibacter flexilis DSM 6793]
MITFFPGPSRVYPQVATFMQEAFEQGLLSISHRSETFNQMSEKTIGLVKSKLNVPADYTVFYTSSATENWEIIAQSLTTQQSTHFYSGAFGEKWHEYARKIHSQAEGFRFDTNDHADVASWQVAPESEVICITQNETSNGTQIPAASIEKLRELHPEKLIAVDVTSSLAGIALPFAAADIWYGSVQKCFGLPAGLGLLICSPRAIERAQSIGERGHYNSFLVMLDNIKKWQTSCTPNVLGIYLLMRVLETMPHISEIDAQTKARACAYYEAVQAAQNLSLLVENEAVRSDTVVAVKGTKEQVAAWKTQAKQAGILLGAGYGSWKETSFRIANFPALQPAEVAALLDLLPKLS